MLINADAIRIPLADRSIHCVVTSPPYWSLRDYGISGQLGLEQTPEDYVDTMVRVFREVRRVMRDDAVLWLNMGDSYAGSTQAGNKVFGNAEFNVNRPSRANTKTPAKEVPPQLKPLDLCNIPHWLASALQADGWYWRSTIVWHKPNPMPESVNGWRFEEKDGELKLRKGSWRPTTAHEYVFLMAKTKDYFCDAEAVREKMVRKPGLVDPGNIVEKRQDVIDHLKSRGSGGHFDGHKWMMNPSGRNLRTVWKIPTKPYSGAHFATFPPALVEPCIKAGAAEKVCAECGAPWAKVVEVGGGMIGRSWNYDDKTIEKGQWADSAAKGGDGYYREVGDLLPTCEHEEYTKATVFDPFVGSGTVIQVARALGRYGCGTDLSFPYLQLARERLLLTKIDAFYEGIDGETSFEGLPMFSDEEAEKDIPKQDKVGKRQYTGFNARWKEKHGS